jgi:epoxyqueuosine reductase
MDEFIPSLNVKQQIIDVLHRLQHSHYGLAALGQPLHFELYKNWVENEYHGEMAYLKNHIPLKSESHYQEQKIKSSIVIGFEYFEHPKPSPHYPFRGLKVARYAKGEDYHFWIKDHLNKIVSELKLAFPDEQYLVATDSSPILERDLAYRAGLGWVGKNSMLIHQKKGSYFLLGEILTSLDVSPHIPPISADHCGTCNRCIEACPTSAILDNRTIDARKCISYWTIESKKIPPKELREQFKSWFFGCDICQEVCPWNAKKQKAEATTSNHIDDLINDLKWILEKSNKQLEEKLKYLPLSRARGFGLKRNAMIIIANEKLKSCESLIQPYVQDERLGELAQWTLAELNAP